MYFVGNKRCCIVLYCVALRCVALRCVALRCVALRCVALRCVALRCVALRCVALRCVALRCVVLCCVVLYCIVLYCIVLFVKGDSEPDIFETAAGNLLMHVASRSRDIINNSLPSQENVASSENDGILSGRH